MKPALAWIAAGCYFAALGLTKIRTGGPCTIDQALIGLVLLPIGVLFASYGLFGPGATAFHEWRSAQDPNGPIDE